MYSGNSVTATLGLLIHAAGNEGFTPTIVFPHYPDKTDYITVPVVLVLGMIIQVSEQWVNNLPLCVYHSICPILT